MSDTDTDHTEGWWAWGWGDQGVVPKRGSGPTGRGVLEGSVTGESGLGRDSQVKFGGGRRRGDRGTGVLRAGGIVGLDTKTGVERVPYLFREGMGTIFSGTVDTYTHGRSQPYVYRHTRPCTWMCVHVSIRVCACVYIGHVCIYNMVGCVCL